MQMLSKSLLLIVICCGFTVIGFSQVSGGNYFSSFGSNGHTNGYTFGSVQVEINGKTTTADYIINDTRMQIRLKDALAAGGGKVDIHIKYSYAMPGAFGNRTDYNDTKNGKIF